MAEKNLRNCEIMQYLEYVKIETIKNGLTNKMVKDYAYIVHDKDTEPDGKIKPHVHVMLRLNNPYKASTIGGVFGVAPQYVGSIKGRFADGLKYLTHMNAPEKHQYSDEEVISNFDFKLERTLNTSDVRKSEIINGINNGTIREFNLYECITVDEFDKYRKNIKNAFDYRINKISMEVDRQMEVIYIQGVSGSGKTTMAKELAKANNYSVYISSGSNDVLDNYKGQDCLILDDLRPSCMGLSDLLKMLDNNTSSTVKSRYRNKVLECKLVIVTSVLPLEEFYNKVFTETTEPIVQFKRRCQTLIKVTKETVTNYIYLAELDKYMFMSETPNDIFNKYPPKTVEEMVEEKIKLMGNVIGSLETNKEDIVKNLKMQIERELKEKAEKELKAESENKCPF